MFLTKTIFGFNSFAIWFSLPIQSIAISFMLPYLSTVKTGKGIVFRGLTFISIISYSTYLLNFAPVSAFLEIDRIQVYTNVYKWLPFVIYLFFSFGLAYLLNRFIEKPFIELRDKKALKLKSVLVFNTQIKNSTENTTSVIAGEGRMENGKL